MKKKLKKGAAKAAPETRNVPRVSIGALAEKNMKDYGTFTIEDRAIPSIYDGQKPVHRRIMFTMFKMGLFNNVAHRKAAKVYGQVMGDYHPHGDAAIYGAMVGISTGNGTPLALIDGQGNWGNFDGSPAAAGRYTECRLTKYATEILVPKAYMDKDVISYIPNYDGTLEEPQYLPSLLPTGFMLGAYGIATGVTVSMPAYTYESVLAATKRLMKTGSGKKAAAKLIPCERWGAVMNSDQADLDNYHKTGEGKLEWIPQYTVKRDNTGTVFVLTSLPPMGWETFYNGLMKIKGVYSVVNLTGRKTGMQIEITVKDEACVPAVKKRLTVTESYRSAATMLVGNFEGNEPLETKFATYTPIEILEQWREWRIGLEKRLIKHLISDNDIEIARLRLMVLAASKIDIIFSILKAKTGDKVKMIERQLKVSSEDAKTIWQMAVSRLDRLNADETKAQIEALEKTNRKLKADYKVPSERILRMLDTLPSSDPNGKKKAA